MTLKPKRNKEEDGQLQKETLQILDETKEKGRVLREKIDDLYALGEEKGVDIDLLLANGNLLTEKQIQDWLDAKNALDEVINTSGTNSDSKQKSSKSRKTETRGVRNKWISVK